MFDITEAVLRHAAVHVIDHKNSGKELKLSTGNLDLTDDTLRSVFSTYFLSNFQSPEYFSFTFSNEDFTLNPVYKFVSDVFYDVDFFHENSVNIARHLFEASQHPNIKSGDIYVAYLSGLVIDNKVVDAVGIFKSENKDTYLKLRSLANDFIVDAENGVNIKKLDKGCLIFNTDSDAGFKMCIVDNSNRSEAQFWKHDFLNVKPWSDAFHYTANFMNFTRQYLADQMQEEFQVSKADQIDLMNRSVNFFKDREQFDQREFEVQVLGDANVIESFRKFGQDFGEQNAVDIIDNFEISVQAVKRQARIFKSVLKLDKNFHIYIHGDRELIEKGFDEAVGKHYYKIYFDKES